MSKAKNNETVLEESESAKKAIARRKKEKSGFESGIGAGPVIAIISIVLVISLFVVLKLFDFKKDYVVKFNTDGGTEISSQTIKKNDKAETPEEPAKEGYEFKGWYLEDKEYDFDTKVTKDINLVAKWESINKAKVTGISIDQKELALLPNEEITLVAVIEPNDAKDKKVIWKSSNDNVATIDDNGLVSAKNVGVTYITATTDEGEFKAKCTIVVSNDIVKVTGIELSESKITLGIGYTKIISATITPKNATNTGITWESEDKNVATVNGLGVIKGISKGKTTIVARTKDGSYTAKINVEVKKK